MQSQINTRLFKLKAGPRRLDPTAVNCCASPGGCVHTVVWKDLFQVLSTLLLLPFLGSSDGELGKQSLRHCRLGNLRRDHVLNSQESQVQTVTFWRWLCDPWETWQHLKKMGSRPPPSLLGLYRTSYSLGSISNGDVSLSTKQYWYWGASFINIHGK